ncbi:PLASMODESMATA CALLOSE-BINDING PROTEIN 5-like [Andrographis paniculata]|uniref:PLASMODESMATA CALLOSE-BINDING PROTEIN 5-like n=1 Tax=Andrographis paniculata TaxID=175694 RepID=UPI0021E743EF|nr:PLASMODESMATA CALLOSE-BINDING PROTEIN 5-like [Andrographis paniculata]
MCKKPSRRCIVLSFSLIHFNRFFFNFSLLHPQMGSASTSVTSLLFLLCSLMAVAAAAQGGRSAGAGRQLWCVAKNNAEDAALQSALDWCCGYGGADCGPIQKGGPCYDASDLQRTASFAFNDYYVKHGPSDESCSFGSTAALTSLNPSHHNCNFPSSLSSLNGNFTATTAAGSESGSGSTAYLSSSSLALNRAWELLAITLLFAASRIL